MGPHDAVETHSKLDPGEVHVRLLQPVIEVLGIVGGVTLAVRGHAEDHQGLVNLRQAAQVGLERQGGHHCGRSPQLMNRVAGGKALVRAVPRAFPINGKGSLAMGEGPWGSRVESVEGKERASGGEGTLREGAPY